MTEKQDKNKCIEVLGEDLVNKLETDKKLTIKQIRFCAEYLINGFIGVRAYMVAFDLPESKYASAKVLSHRLLTKVNIKNVLKKLNNEWLDNKKEIFERKIIGILDKEAFYDPFDFINKAGFPAFKNKEDIPKDLRPCITGIKTKFIGLSSKPSIEIKLADRYKALELLGKYINLFKEDINVHHGLSEEAEKKLEKIFNDNKKR